MRKNKMSKKEKLKELYAEQERIVDYIINTEFTKEELHELEDLANEIDIGKEEINKKLNPLYD